MSQKLIKLALLSLVGVGSMKKKIYFFSNNFDFFRGGVIKNPLIKEKNVYCFQ